MRFDGTAKFRSDYYFITDNPKYPDARLSIYERFLTSAELGAKQGQKQITVANFDTETTMPSISCLVLRAWFLQRASLNGWIDRKNARRKWYDREVVDLRAAVRSFGVTGSAAWCKRAYDLIKQWAPSVVASV